MLDQSILDNLAQWQGVWAYDQIRFMETGELLLYSGGIVGNYHLILKDGGTYSGQYRDAYPDISHAHFTTWDMYPIAYNGWKDALLHVMTDIGSAQSYPTLLANLEELQKIKPKASYINMWITFFSIVILLLFLFLFWARVH